MIKNNSTKGSADSEGLRLDLPRRAKVLALVGGTFVLLAFLTAEVSAQEVPDDLGETTFEEYCAVCHEPAMGGAPTVESMNGMSPNRIRVSLEGGVMETQAEDLSAIEIQRVAEYLSKRKPSEVPVDRSTWMCSVAAPDAGKALWSGWGVDAANRRFLPDARHEFRRSNVTGLRLKWAFGFPEAVRARSQPVVTETMVYVGSQEGDVYALDRASGCVWWSFKAAAEVRNSVTVVSASGTAEAPGDAETLYVGDFEANVYALRADTGELIWTRNVGDHPDATITGSIAHSDGKLFVPMSSSEIISAFYKEYECCTFRGGVLALRAEDGESLWRMYTTDVATTRGKNSHGVPQLGPSGAPVWSSPTIDAARDVIYVGTGENYSSPANGMSDAIIAIDRSSGDVRWVQQTISGDAWNGGCENAARVNCPKEDGPDFDFGAPPILANVGGKDFILAGQKSGMIFAMDPDDGGRILWQRRLGMGGFNGGVHWGMSVSGKNLIVPITDTPGNRFTTGDPRPGLHALDIKTGEPVWSTFHPADEGCKGNRECYFNGLSSAATSTEELAFASSLKGVLGVYDLSNGERIWTFETRRDFDTVNKVPARGGTIDSDGVVIAGNQLLINSGYDKWGEIAGNVLLVFELPQEELDAASGLD